MAALDIFVRGDGMAADIPRDKLAHTTEPLRIGALDAGTDGGKPSVAILAILPNGGGAVLAETTLALFLAAADAFKAAYGDPRV